MILLSQIIRFSLRFCFSIPLGVYPEVEVLDHVLTHFKVLSYCQIAFQKDCILFFFAFSSKGPLSPQPPQTCFYFFLIGSMIIGNVVFAGLLLLLVCSQLPFSGGGGE